MPSVCQKSGFIPDDLRWNLCHCIIGYRFENGDYAVIAEMSGVPLRTRQQYEQRKKHINKAQAEYLVMLAKALCCEVDALLEKV